MGEAPLERHRRREGYALIEEGDRHRWRSSRNRQLQMKGPACQSHRRRRQRDVNATPARRQRDVNATSMRRQRAVIAAGT